MRLIKDFIHSFTSPISLRRKYLMFDTLQNDEKEYRIKNTIKGERMLVNI